MRTGGWEPSLTPAKMTAAGHVDLPEIAPSHLLPVFDCDAMEPRLGNAIFGVYVDFCRNAERHTVNDFQPKVEHAC